MGVHCGQSAVSDNPLGTSLLTGAGALISRKDCSGSPRLFRYAVRYDRDGVVTRAARCDQSFDLLKHMITMVVCLPTAEPGSDSAEFYALSHGGAIIWKCCSEPPSEMTAEAGSW